MTSQHWRQIPLLPAIVPPLTRQSLITQFSKSLNSKNPPNYRKIQSKGPKMVKEKHYWLLKTEPGEWSWEDQSANGGVSNWDGVKNKQAQKNLKAMRIGDLCFFYHSGARFRRVVGVVSVVREWYGDGEGSDGAVDVSAVGEMSRPVDLKEMKGDVELKDFGLFRQPRLSVVPVPEDIWDRICELGGGYSGVSGDDDNGDE